MAARGRKYTILFRAMAVSVELLPRPRSKCQFCLLKISNTVQTRELAAIFVGRAA